MGWFGSQDGKKRRSTFEILTGKSTGKIPLGMPRCTIWEGNIRRDLEEICINWFDSAQDMDYCECSTEPLGSINHGVSSLNIFFPSNISFRIFTI